jgi:hypothetical protein
VSFGEKEDDYVMCLEEYMEFIFVLGEAVGVPDCKVEGRWDYVSLDRTAVRRDSKDVRWSKRPFITDLSF